MKINTIAILIPKTVFCYECGEIIRHCEKCQHEFKENEEILCYNKNHYCAYCAEKVKR